MTARVVTPASTRAPSSSLSSSSSSSPSSSSSSSSSGGEAARGAAGVTLIELMVVLAMIGILLTVALFAIRTDPDVDDAARSMSALLRETSRKAVSGGAVREDVAQATLISARTHLRVFYDGGSQIASIERLKEDDGSPTANWVELERRALPASVRVVGYSPTAQLDAAGLTPAVALADGDELEVKCFPTGSCDPVTMFLRDVPGGDRRARVVLIPLSGIPHVFDDW